MLEPRICPSCNTLKDGVENNKKRGVEGKSSYCKPCTIMQTSTRQKNLKIKAVNYLGGKCASCGYNKCVEALDFHHLDPNKKEFSISQAKSHSFSKVKPELDKCVLLCANCHREEHAAILVNNESKWNQEFVLSELDNAESLDSYQRYSPRTKIDWLPDDELAKIVWEYPRSHLAKVWGVSDKAIANRLNLRGIEQPKRGYWAKLRASKK